MISEVKNFKGNFGIWNWESQKVEQKRLNNLKINTRSQHLSNDSYKPRKKLLKLLPRTSLKTWYAFRRGSKTNKHNVYFFTKCKSHDGKNVRQ